MSTESAGKRSALFANEFILALVTASAGAAAGCSSSPAAADATDAATELTQSGCLNIRPSDLGAIGFLGDDPALGTSYQAMIRPGFGTEAGDSLFLSFPARSGAPDPDCTEVTGEEPAARGCAPGEVCMGGEGCVATCSTTPPTKGCKGGQVCRIQWPIDTCSPPESIIEWSPRSDSPAPAA